MGALVRSGKSCVLALLAAGALAGCGGDGSSDAKALKSADGDAPAASSPAPTSPEARGARVRELVTASYPATIPAWVAKYTADWGATPDAAWTAEQQDGDRWVGRFVLSVPEGQRVETEWTIDGLADPKRTASPTEPIAPANPAARRFTRYPKADPPRRGPVRLFVTVLEREQGSGDLGVILESTDAVTATQLLGRSGRLNKPLLRGFALLGKDPNSGRTITTDAGTEFRAADGRRISARSFGQLVASGGPQVSTALTWSSFPSEGTLEALLRKAPAKVQIAGGS